MQYDRLSQQQLSFFMFLHVIRKNRAMQHDCDLDVADKHHAQGVDDLAHQLRNRSCKVGFHPGVEKNDNTYVAFRNAQRKATL